MDTDEKLSGLSLSSETKTNGIGETSLCFVVGIPLSRLEFPLDSWWAGVSMRREFSRFSAGVEFFRNLSDEARGVMMDSDWDDDAQPALKTIYSESSC